MSAYESFARVYDMFMDNIPYKEWCNYLTGLLKEYEVDDGLVLELGCGTGNATRLLSDAGYDMIGVDNAPDMLEIALEKKEEEGQDILYLCQDMREFELYGTVKAIVSICDSMNYITEDEDLLEVFKLVNNYLDPEGVFIFDLNTVYKYEKSLENRRLRRIARMPALSGIIIMMKKNKLMNMIWHCLFRRARMVFIENMKKFIISGLMSWSW